MGLRAFVLGVANTIPVFGGIATGVDIFLTSEAAAFERIKFDILLDELSRGDRQLTSADMSSEPVIRACIVTIEATLRTSREQKIRWFARLLLAGSGPQPQLSMADEHEDYFKILDDLSYREIGILAMLASFEGHYPELSRLERASTFWVDFTKDVCTRFTIPDGELPGLLTRLSRTGVYDPIVGAYLGYEGGKGELSPLYRRLVSLTGINIDQFEQAS